MRAKTAGDHKTKLIGVRVSAAEFAVWAKAAERDRRKLADWVRVRIQEALR